jgi:cardiolipin synthase A/B
MPKLLLLCHGQSTWNLENGGLSDYVEFRFFDGETHIKSALIDNEFLVIGSQNYHYSAWGAAQGLTEYNLAFDDPEAITDYQKIFEYRWKNGIR